MRATRAITKMERSMGMDNSYGLMAPPTMANSWRTTFMARVSTPGLMADSTMASGKITRWMAQASSLGQTEGNMKESTSTIRRRVMAFSHGLMADSTMVIGKMESSTDSECITRARAR